MNDFDKYYTPLNIATKIIEKANFSHSKIFVDPTCGSGNLLTAAEMVFGDAACFGIDKDKAAINALRRIKPDWCLSVADFLKVNSYKKTKTSAVFKKCDLVLLNPPFSHFKNKYVEIAYNGKNLKGSVAMSYLLRSLELFSPMNGAIIIAPESLLYSQTDECGRNLLKENFLLEHIEDLECKTFYGARVHSCAFKLIPQSYYLPQDKVLSNNMPLLNASLVRGALPVYKSNQVSNSKDNVQFIHTTDLKYMKENFFYDKKYTSVTATGRLCGDAILIPRVGMPNLLNVKIYSFNEIVQLSDCIIAIQCLDSFESLKEIERRLTLNWSEFYSMYKGTGARYITIDRLKRFLYTLNVLI